MSVYCNDKPAMFERAVISIVNQQLNTNDNVRIYLGIDGHVGDDLNNVIQRYQNFFYNITRVEKNCGLAHILNLLIDQLDNEDLVFRMDADDESLLSRFQVQSDYLKAFENVDILGGSIIECYENSDLNRVVKFPRTHKDVLNMINYRSPLAHPTVCFRPRVLHRLRYPTVELNEDIAMWFDCIFEGFIFANVEDVVLKFTVSEHFYSNRGRRKAWGEFKVWIRGIYKLHGLTFKLVYPFFRLLFRMLPNKLKKIGYSVKSF